MLCIRRVGPVVTGGLMSIGSLVRQSVAHAILEEACARNQVGDLVYHAPSDERFRAKVRFLAVSDELLTIDMPVSEGRMLSLRQGDPVTLYLGRDGQRLAFQTSVFGRLMYSIGGAAPVPAVRLMMPERIERSQRRECYRLSTVHMVDANVTIQPVDAHPDARPIQGIMINVSESGCGAVFELSRVRSLEPGDLFNVSFTMPGEPDAFSFTAETHWTQLDEAGARIRVGFSWALDLDRPEHRREQTRLGRSIMAEQRRLLRRERMRF